MKFTGFNAVGLLLVGLLVTALLILTLFPRATQVEDRGEDRGEDRMAGQGERGTDALSALSADIAAQSSAQSSTQNGNQKSGVDIFADLRFEREKSRSRKQELFANISEDPESASDLKNAAQQELWRLTRLTALEDELEGILRARGYQPVIVLLQDRNATVLVGQNSLKDAEVSDIAGIIARITGIPGEGIRIYEKRPSD